MLKNKTILVLGACGLLGREIVKAIIEQKGKVIAVDLDIKSLSINDPSISCFSLDVTNEKQVIDFFDRGLIFHGAVNCTYPRNKQYGSHLFDVSLDSFNENVGLHLGSAFLIMQQCAKYFKRHGHEFSLVNIASIYGVIGPDFSIYENTTMTMPVEYAAIKSAIIQLNKYITQYVHDSSFRVNSVSPGGIFDSQPQAFLDAYKQKTHGQGMLLVQDVVQSLIFLLSDQSRYITGQNILVDDGFSL
jgi:NAD(P)-dependent dehydrogenase (short-subunit alcohol dehydrogenase family)